MYARNISDHALKNRPHEIQNCAWGLSEIAADTDSNCAILGRSIGDHHSTRIRHVKSATISSGITACISSLAN